MERATSIVLTVEGMTCASCVRHVRDALGEVPGVVAVDVQLDERLAIVEHEGQVDLLTLTEALEREGYVARRVG